MCPTAGELQNKLRLDTTKYDQLEVGHAVTEDYWDELRECAKIHNPMYSAVGLDDYYIISDLVKDPLLSAVVRRKFHAWPCLPQPRPGQSVFYYNHLTDKIINLWVLPKAATMAYISELSAVSKFYLSMKEWSDAFFDQRFWGFIKSQNTETLLTDREFFALHGDKFAKFLQDQGSSLDTEPLDDGKISFNEIVDTVKAVQQQ